MDCPLCQTRALLSDVNRLIDQTPEIHSALYDDAIAELSNQVSNTIGLFQCMCDEDLLDGSDTSMAAQLDDAGFGSFGPM